MTRVENIFANYFLFFFSLRKSRFLQSAKSFFVFCVLLNSLTLQPPEMFPFFAI